MPLPKGDSFSAISAREFVRLRIQLLTDLERSALRQANKLPVSLRKPNFGRQELDLSNSEVDVRLVAVSATACQSMSSFAIHTADSPPGKSR